MTASFCGTNLATTTTNTTATFSHTLTAGTNRAVVVFMGWTTPIDLNITGVTYGGVSMTQQGTQLESNTTIGARAAIFTLNEASLPANGAQTVDPSWSATSANTHISCYVWCLQDVASPTYIASGTSGTSLAYYPTTATATGVNANSVLLTASVHTDVSTGALSCNVGTQDTEINTVGEIRSRTSYILDTGVAADQSAVWSVASESANTRGVAPILAIEYTQVIEDIVSEGWGIIV
jgi:hypothetical protein